MARTPEAELAELRERVAELERSLARVKVDSKRVEEELRVSQQRLHDAIESIPDGFALYDADDRLVLFNTRYKQTYSKHAEVFVQGSRFEDMLREGVYRGEFADAVGREEAWIAERLETHLDPQGPIEQRLSDGRWLRTEERRTRDGGTVGLRTDITRLKSAEAALRKSEEAFKSTFDHTPSAISLQDLSGRYQLVNRRFVAWYGVAEADAVGHTSEEVFPDAYAAVLSELDHEVLEQRSVVERELEVELAEGLAHEVALTKFPVLDEEEKIIGVGTIAMDITEQKRTERQLRESQRMEAVGRLAGGVAQDFNNMLQIITSYADAAILVEDGSRREEFLNNILAAAERAAKLTGQLLAFSRRTTMQASTLDLSKVAADAGDMIGRLLGPHIELELCSQEAVDLVAADPAMLEQVIVNLCVNARDAMAQGGKLTIETRNLEVDESVRDARNLPLTGSFVTLSVRDTGVGMTSEVRERAFEPFFTTKDVGSGSGLGLSMVYGIVQQLGGMIEIESEPERGTRCTIYLPRTKTEPEPSVASDDAEPPGGAETILIAEDEEALLDLLKILLERRGYRVLSAAGGRQALSVFEDNADSIDLVVLDVLMPEIGGKKVFEAIRETGSKVPVLFSTGFAHSSLDAEFLAESGARVVRKPYAPETLLKIVREALDERSSSAVE